MPAIASPDKTREDFIFGYCERSKITREFFDKHFEAVPCNCGEEGCTGWEALTKAHLDLLKFLNSPPPP